MKTILFRGKRTDNGEWVEGAYMPYYYSSRYGKISAIFVNNDVEGRTYRYPVISETVGKYTGLDDKNGKPIYEGDIVMHDCTGYGDYENRVVKWDDDAAMLGTEMNGIMFSFRVVHNSRLEVIGNIYDNPELLEEA